MRNDILEKVLRLPIAITPAIAAIALMMNQDRARATPTKGVSVSRWPFSMDSHILAVLLTRGWTIFAGAVTLFFIPSWLTLQEQGYFYTFFSLLALQVFFELGFNGIVIQWVGHEAPFVRVSASGQLEGDSRTVDRLRSLLKLLHRWYLVASLLFAVAMSVTGVYFFSTRPELPSQVWLPIWLVLVFTVAISLYLSPLLSFMEGLGWVREVARVRLVQSVVGYSLMWTAMGLNAGLYAVPALTLCSAITSFGWVKKHQPRLFPAPGVTETSSLPSMSWRKEIFPLQWRIALSWISGYFIFHAFTPLVFAHQGPEEAGRLGLGLTIFSSLSTLGMSWVTACVPRFASYIVIGNRRALNSLFISVTSGAVLVTTLACCLVLLGAWATQWLNRPITERIPSLPVLLCLALVTVANCLISSEACYIRAHKVEPLLSASLVVGLITINVAYFGSRISTTAMMALYAATIISVALPWASIIFLQYFGKK